MKKLLATALLSFGLFACNEPTPAPAAAPTPVAEVTTPVAVAATPVQATEASMSTPTTQDSQPQWSDELAASSSAGIKQCPWYAPRCCGYLHNGLCTGTCVGQNSQCP